MKPYKSYKCWENTFFDFAQKVEHKKLKELDVCMNAYMELI
jgi:hypothetical protein